MKKNVSKNIKKCDNKKGFTLIELIVVIAIIAVISALSLFNSSRLNSSVLLSNTAYEIGLVIRDAQVSGLGAKVISINTGDDMVATTSNQGIFISSLNPDEVVLFADLNKNNTYDSGSGETSQIFIIENKRAGKIIKICEIKNSDNSCVQKTDLTIMFKRPNPEAYFYTNETNTEGPGYIGSVAVNVGFVDDECRTIIIYKTGAIQIDKSFCD